LVVEVIGDSSKLGKSLDQAGTKAQGFGSKLKGVGTGLTIGAGAAAFNLVTTAISIGIGKLGEAQQAYRDDQVSQAKMATVLKNAIPNWNGNTDAIEKYATAQQGLGFSDDSVRDSISKLVGVTHDQNEAMALNSLAMDLARAKNISLEQATAIVTKAHEGNGKALKGLGIDIGNAKTGAELLQAAQDNVKGSAEAWAATSEGKAAVSQTKVAEAMEKVGMVVDKVSSVVIPALADAFVGVTDWIASIWPTVGPIVGKVMDIVGEAIGFVSKNVLPALGEAFGWIVKNVIPPLSEAFGWIVKNVFPALSEAFGWIVKNVIPPLATVIGWVVETVLPPLVKALGFITENIVPAVGAAFKLLGDIIGGVFDVVPRVIKGALNFVIDIVNGMIGAINGIQFHVHAGPINYDFDGLNLGKIPRLHSGGIVPGPIGSEVPIMALGGERVSPPGASATPQVVVHIHGHVIGLSGADELAELIARRLRLNGSTV
jgi:hypothetical protein